VEINLESRVILLFREADYLAKINLEIQIVALIIFTKKDHFTLITVSIQLMIQEFVCIYRQARKIGSSPTIVTAFSLCYIFIRTWLNNFDMDQNKLERFLSEYEGADQNL